MNIELKMRINYRNHKNNYNEKNGSTVNPFYCC